jgi:NADPH:quinone reductase-like Zn-dependent oxidoreductase
MAVRHPTVVVTGASGAIGSATVEALKSRGANVIAMTRSSLDLSSMTSVRTAARELNRANGHIDALLHIAAIFTTRYQKTKDGMELMLATNHLGPFLFTNLLRDRLTPGGRVLTVTAPSTTRIDKRWDVVANAFHPGLVRSELMRETPRPFRFVMRLASSSPARAARDLVDLALSPAHAGTTGWFFKGTRHIEAPRPTQDIGQQSALWQKSADLVELEGGF